MSGGQHVFDEVPELRELADRQGGVVRRDQLTALGISPNQVAHQTRALRWRTLGPTLVVVHTGALSRREQMWAAVLHSGGPSDDGLVSAVGGKAASSAIDLARGAGLAAWSALEVQGFQRWHRADVHVVTSRAAKVIRLPGLVVHYSRRFDPTRDMVSRQGLPTTSAARAAIDAASWSARSDHAVALLAAVVQQRLVTTKQLRMELTAAGSVRHCGAMREHLPDLSAGAAALSEIRMGPILRAAGLPLPRRAVPRTIDGVNRFLDMEVGLPDGTVLVIEVDGPDHDGLLARSVDTLRDLDNLAGARATIRVTPWMVRNRAPALIAKLQELRKAAEARKQAG